MAAARFAERHHALGGTARITLHGAEPRPPYNRVLLADVLTGRYAAEAVALPSAPPNCASAARPWQWTSPPAP